MHTGEYLDKASSLRMDNGFLLAGLRATFSACKSDSASMASMCGFMNQAAYCFAICLMDNVTTSAIDEGRCKWSHEDTFGVFHPQLISMAVCRRSLRR